MKKLFLLLIFSTVACAYEPPTAPDPVATSERTIVQLSLRVTGVDTWWTDRIFVAVSAYDQTGSELNTIVACDASEGSFEPRQFPTQSRIGVLVKGVRPGNVLTCHYQKIEASYVLTDRDWWLKCCGAQTPTVPKPTTPTVPNPTTTP